MPANSPDGESGYRLDAPRCAQDWHAYHGIRRKVFHLPRPEEDDQPGHPSAAAVAEDRPIGAIQVDDLRNAAAALRLVAIDPAHQGGGHGRAMLERAEAFVRTLGCRKAVVYSTVGGGGILRPYRLRRGRLGRGLHGRHRADAERTGLSRSRSRCGPAWPGDDARRRRYGVVLTVQVALSTGGDFSSLRDHLIQHRRFGRTRRQHGGQFHLRFGFRQCFDLDDRVTRLLQHFIQNVARGGDFPLAGHHMHPVLRLRRPRI